MVRIGIAGIGGRMGGEILSVASGDSLVTVAGGTERPERVVELGGTFGATALVTTDVSELIPFIEVLIDFTTPEATLANARACADGGCRLVAGTTGLNVAQLAELTELSSRTAIFYARNMSVGVNALLAVLPGMVRALDTYDIEIVEMHHRHKADAPSGTALAIAEVIASALDQDLQAHAVYGREGVAPRQRGEIGIHAVRGGGNSGEHTIIFAEEGEEIRVGHRAFSRRTFALGAVRAAKYLSNKQPGFYAMSDMLRSVS